jgi:hypothetical protein
MLRNVRPVAYNGLFRTFLQQSRPDMSKRSLPLVSVVLILFVALWCVPSVRAEARSSGLVIDDQFPGGNIIVERIEGDRVDLRPDLRDTQGWWFYWNFRVRGAQGRTLTFRFVDRNPIGVRGPAVSTDQGLSWSWLGADRVQDASFRYSFAADADEVRFCFAMPYQQEHFERFLADYRDNRYLSVQQLCTSRAGRSIERLHVGDFERQPRYRIFLAARHHACESMASYTLEGFVAAALADTDDGRWFREHVHLLAVPFVDKDGVEQGDQGKNRKPHDHNRDYRGESIYPSVAAIRALLPAWSERPVGRGVRSALPPYPRAVQRGDLHGGQRQPRDVAAADGVRPDPGAGPARSVEVPGCR